MKMKSAVLAGLGLACFGTAPWVMAKEQKIATVDMQKTLQTMESGKKAKAQLEKEFNSKRTQLQAEEAAIKKMSEEFKKKSLVMNDQARGKKQAELQERIMKFQELTARSQSEIQQKERDLTQPIVADLRTVISDIAKKRDYSLVLEKNENTVLFSMDQDDLTADVIAAADKKVKTVATQ